MKGYASRTPNSNLTDEEKQWGMMCHLAGALGPFFPTIGHIGCPLLLWLWKRNTSQFVDVQGKESLNFQISITIYACLSLLPIFLILRSMLIHPIVGLFFLGIFGIFSFVLAIIAAIRVGKGENYRYPLTIRFLK